MDVVKVRSLDGTRLVGVKVAPPDIRRAVVLVHGGGVTRDEGGFFTRLTDGLAAAGIAALRFDLRGHGDSHGRREQVTLSGVGNDIRAAAEWLATDLSLPAVTVLGASFSGGVCAALAARHPELVERLVLFNPLLDYKQRFIDQKPYWTGDRLDPDHAAQLAADGWLPHSPTFPLSAALLNEVFWWDVRAELPHISAPTLIVHGTADTFIPIDSSRAAAETLRCRHRLVEIDGAQHGFAVHDDPAYADPQTQRWQAEVITQTAAWLSD
jgi:pimeloyl-ACP methyl ester carboxylesterase